MTAPNIESSTREEHSDYVLNGNAYTTVNWLLAEDKSRAWREQKPNLFGLCRVVTEEDEVSTLGMFTAARCALKGQQCQNTSVSYPCFCPCRAHFIASSYPGWCLGLCARCPFFAPWRLLPLGTVLFYLRNMSNITDCDTKLSSWLFQHEHAPINWLLLLLPIRER